MSSTPHDRSVQNVFTSKEQAIAHLRAFLPGRIHRLLDLDTTELIPGTFVDRKLARRESDLLFRIRRKARDFFIYVLWEHQSKSDPMMAWRLLGYLIRIWERWLKDHPKAKRLPVIIPVVLYNGRERWNAPLRFADLLDLDDDARKTLAPELPDFGYRLVDLFRMPDAELRKRVEGQAALAGLTAFFLKLRDADRILAHASAWTGLLRRLGSEPGGWEALGVLVYYAHETSDEPGIRKLIDFIVEQTAPQAWQTIMTSAEKLRKEGWAEGWAEGKAEGLRTALQRLLRIRFGDVPPEIMARIETADTTTIESWLDHAAVASDLNAVFER